MTSNEDNPPVMPLDWSRYVTGDCAFRVMGDNILIKKDKPKTMEGGIAIPEAAQEKTLKATVLAMGPGKEVKFDSLGQYGVEPMPDIEPGTRLLIRKWSEDDVPVGDGKTLTIIKPGSILAVIEAQSVN